MTELKIKNRTILHCDLNNFFASVEMVKNPDLKDKAIAVCGSVKDRRGIVLAKNELAKSFGVKTAEPIWMAMKKCRNLVIVPPSKGLYEEFSKKAYEIYTRYTDKVEPFGIDECYLDVSGSFLLFGSGEDIAMKIKEDIKHELGITASVGVSFNKVFAKLGSDMKKPDGLTIISKENFKEKVWCLPCSDMLGVGGATQSKLSRYYIENLGQLATTPPEFLKEKFGVHGYELWRNANGLDTSEVSQSSYKRELKTIGNSTTPPEDLTSNDEVWTTLLKLSQNVCERLRKHNMYASGVCISIKTSDFQTFEFQKQLEQNIFSAVPLCKAGYELFLENYNWRKNLRSVGIRAISLKKTDEITQMNLFEDTLKKEKLENLDKTMDNLRNKYGKRVVTPLSII